MPRAARDPDAPAAPVPARPSLARLRETAQKCRACELWRGATQAGIERSDIFITNVVKHFRYKTRGKRRIHQRPERIHVAACRPWLDAELAIVRPEVVVCLGAIAAQALLGPHVRIGRDRGHPMESELAPLVTITCHPSPILRARGDAERTRAMDEFVADLERVAEWLRS